MTNEIATKIMNCALSCAYALHVDLGSKLGHQERIIAYCDCWCIATGKNHTEFRKELDRLMAEAIKDWK